MPTALQVLQSYFGYKGFRPLQANIIEAVVTGHDTLAILPTGGGKSLCYQIPSLLLEGTTVVISPLISLMKDQVEALERRKIKACYINSSMSAKKLQQTLSSLKQSRVKLVYVAPERLKSQKFIKLCKQINITLIAIDEAHCISEWGHDFRPSYRLIADFITKLKKRPTVMAVTATATPAVQKDIISNLKLHNHQHYQSSFERDNLHFSVKTCQDREEQELAFLKYLDKYCQESGIVYVATRKQANYLARLLDFFNMLSGQVAVYHGGLTAKQRDKVQTLFISRKINWIIATNAFGMGIDRGDVRRIIHYQIPGSIENYYQEAGRAGRDGDSAQCHLLFNSQDIKIQLEMLRSAAQTQTNKDRLLHKLRSMVDYATTKNCRQNSILKYFGEVNQKRCGRCDNCQTPKLLTASDEFSFRNFQILQLRDNLAEKYKIAAQYILTDSMINRIAFHQPKTQSDFLKIPGIGLGWLDRWYNIVSANLKESQIYDNPKPR